MPDSRAWAYISHIIVPVSTPPAAGQNARAQPPPPEAARNDMTPTRMAAWSAPSLTYFISVSARSPANSSVVCGLLLVAPNTV